MVMTRMRLMIWVLMVVIVQSTLQTVSASPTLTCFALALHLAAELLVWCSIVRVCQCAMVDGR
jgi:hypothetical protein